MNKNALVCRAAAVIVRDGQILLMHRLKDGREYYSFPGGSVEEGETPEQAVRREIQEEFTLDIVSEKLLLEMESMGKYGYYYLVRQFTGVPTLGGEEKRIMTRENQYHPAWKPVAELRELGILYPEDVRRRIADLLVREGVV
jgi:mutator protein MutT